MKGETIRIVVAAHKAYPMPEDPMYLPVHVGAALTEEAGAADSLGCRRDDTGENISELNGGFCELTGLYWAWKNLKEDYIGLVHYRRHFSFGKRKGRDVSDVLREAEIKPLLHSVGVFVPKKRWYGIETLYSHYAHTHYAGHLDMSREILKERFPEYLSSFDYVCGQRGGYMFNMMILRRDYLDRYCTWLFGILFELKNRLEENGAVPDELDAYQGRLYGRVSEILFNVWLEGEIRGGRIHTKHIMELPYFGTEKTNWVKKGTAFLRAKLLHEKYSGSF